MDTQLEGLAENLSRGRINRRQFIDAAVRLGVSASVIAPILAACGPSSSSSTKKSQIVVATESSPPGLDPEFFAGKTVGDPMQNVLMALTQWKKIPATETGGWDVPFSVSDFRAATGPGLADSWDVSTDGTVYTFHLHHGWKIFFFFELTSADVKWHFDRAF